MAHRAAHSELRKRHPLRVCGHAKIAIGHDAEHTGALVHHGNEAAVSLPHDLGGTVSDVIRTTRADIPLHQMFDSHDSLLVAKHREVTQVWLHQALEVGIAHFNRIDMAPGIEHQRWISVQGFVDPHGHVI